MLLFDPADLHRPEAGLSELVVVEAPPADPARASAWVADLAARWMPGSRDRG